MTAITQEELDSYKKSRHLSPETFAELFRQNRMVELITNAKALAGTVERINTGEITPADSEKLKV